MTMQKTRKIFIVSMLLGMCLPQATVAQENSPEATAESDEIDEIVVLGGHSLTLLRQEVVVAEDRFFDLYNELNEDDKYDIVCESRRPIGTRIQVRECKAQFVRDAEVEAVQGALQFSNSPANVTARPIRASSEDYEVLDEKLKSFAVSSPELREALMDYDNLNKKYAEEREKKFD